MQKKIKNIFQALFLKDKVVNLDYNTYAIDKKRLNAIKVTLLSNIFEVVKVFHKLILKFKSQV